MAPPSFPLTGMFDDTEPTAITTTTVPIGEEAYHPPMSAIEFIKLDVELKSEDKDKGKKRKADHMTMIVNDWMPATSYYIGKKSYMFLDFELCILLVEQQQMYGRLLMYKLIKDDILCQCCGNVDCVDKLRCIHWHCLTKLTGFLQNTIYDQTWEEVMNSNHLRIEAH